MAREEGGPRAIYLDGVPRPSGPYAHGVIVPVSNLIFTSGFMARDASGQIVGRTIGEQTRQVLENLRSVLNKEGADLKDIVKMSVFLTNASDYDGMNQVRRELCDGAVFASSAIVCALNSAEALIEVEAVAVLPSKDQS